MSGRFKRHLSKASTSAGEAGGTANTSGAMARKKRRLDNVSSDDEERSFWTPKHLGDLKAYNRSASEAPAELFRKDLISAMKLADNEPLTSDDFWGITDQWKQEWERGVQVPVNPDSLPEPSVIKTKDYPRTSRDFRLPRRYIRVTHNDFFNNEKHVLSNLPTKAEKMCRYDMDNLDEAWLKAYNGERARMGAEPVPYHIFELIIEHLEETCWENIHKLLKTEETLAIEFDEDVICDVCRSPDREEGNEMVFCDICNICVHQACYGIMAIPSGSWLCRTCKLGIKPNCDLCPNKGGAMKSTKSGHKWAHVACALWIPEVSIGSVERMEPITKITNIPQSRWALVCVLCRERRGACIQCSVKSCKTAYHVTCAFKHGLEMKPIEDEENADNVKLRVSKSYCEKHSRTGKKDSDGDSDGGGPHPPKKKQDINNEQKNKAKAAKLRQIESEFFKHVDVLQTSTYLDIDYETTETIFYYWKLKRRAGFNKSLLTPRCQELDLLSQQQEQDIERMKMFVQLRQYLERVRNLCYMVSRREKLSRSFLKTREQTFHKQVALLGNDSLNFAPKEAEAIAEANHGHCIYDRIYSHTRAPVHSVTQFENIMGLIANSCKDKAKVGAKAAQSKAKLQISKKKGAPKDINGLLKGSKKPEPELFKNPYRKPYFNGAEERRSRSRSHSNCGSTETSSTEDSDSSLASTKWNPPDPGGHISVFTSSEDEKIFNKSPKFNNNNNIRSKAMFESPSSTKNKTFRDSADEPTQKTIRGRGAGRRGRGRPPTIRGGLSRSTTALKKENAFFSSEEDKSLSPAKDSKVFDALIRTSTRSLRRDSSSSPIKKEPKSLADTSDEEGDKKKQLNRVVRGKGVRKPIRQEALSSSEEELPTPVKAPPKKGKGRGRGRGASRKHSTTTAPSSWPFLPKFSDEEDNLGPATYKLTSEEDEKSDKSILEKEVFPSRLDLFGASSDNRSDASDHNGSPVKREVIKKITKGSDSEENNESEEENKESGEEEESLSHSQLKTKAAMKEFTPKIEAKVEKLNRRRGDRSTKALRGSSTTERIKAEPKPELSDVNCSKETTKLGDAEPSHDLTLFVPQRAAAKKASELITSQNTGGANANQTSCHPPLSQEPTTDKKQQLPKPSSDVIESESSLPPPDDPVKDKKSSSQRIRRGRSSKERQEETKTEVKSDTRDESASEPPKKNIFEPPEILPYVPIREAARKAAENMKGGSGKAGVGGTPLPSQGISEDVETVSPSTPTKQKKNLPKSDTKSLLLRSASKSKSPRSSTKVLGTGSETEEESESVPSIKRTGKESTGPNLRVDKNRSIFSESEDEVLSTPKKEKMLPEKTTELGKELPNKQQLFRGDIFIRDHQSSSENDEEEELKLSQGRESSVKISKKEANEPPPKEDRSKNHSFRSSRNLTRLFGSEGDLREEEHETENEEPPAETRRKAPDKKLKTSDGRPEHGFQPPVTPRDESRVPHDKPANKVSGPNVPSEEGEQRVREGRAKCRSGTAPSDVPHKDIRSDADAPLSIRKQRPSSEAVSDRGERELDGRSRRDGSEGHARGKENREKDARNLQYQHQPSTGKVQLEEPTVFQQQQQKPCLSEPQQHQKQQQDPQHQSKTPKATPEKRFKSTFECISSSVEEETTLIKKETEMGGCNNKANLNIFNFTEKDVEVERLEDIDENSDPEPEPKKVKITDIDEEAVPIAESKVEQPKDSGYKSAIATPEPIDKVQTLCNDNESCQYNTVINDQIPTDVSLSLKKTRLQQLNSPTQLKNNTTRYISPGRRKNLEDVIEERKKIAEQSEFEASLLLDKRIEGSKPLSPQIPDPDSDPIYSEPSADGGRDGTRISQLPISGSTSTGSSVCSTSSAPSSFVEEWREQWEKSPTSQAVQMEHMEGSASYPPLGHPGLPLNDYPCPPYLGPTNPLSAANLMLLSQFNMINSPLNQNMMQIAMLRQLRKSHDSPLEDESNLKVDINSRLPSREDPRPFYGLGECDRSMRMLEHPPKVQIGHHNASKPSGIPSSENSERPLMENKGLPQIAPVSAPQSTFIPSTSLESLKLSYAVTSVASSQSRPFSQSPKLSEVKTEAPEPVSVGLDQSKPSVGEAEPLKKLSSGSDSSKSIGDALETAKTVPTSESPKQVVAALETPKSIASVIERPSVSVGAALEASKSGEVKLEPVKPPITKSEPLIRSIVTRSESSESVVTRLEASKAVVTGLEQSKSVIAVETTKTVEASLEPSKSTSASLKSPKSIKPETEKPAAGHSALKMSIATENNVSVSHVVSSALAPTSTVTNSLSKLSSVPVVSSAAASTKKTTSVLSSNLTDSKSTVKKIQSPTSVVSTKVTTTSSVASIISSTHKTTTCDVNSLKVTSPIPSVLSPTSSTPGKGSSPNLVTVDTSVLHSPPTKRIPIYMQDPKVPKSLEKRSPRAPATSPRWSNNKEKKERNTRGSRSVRGKGGRGRGSAKNKRKGGNLRYNSISVPKELVGTVYEFDDEFDDDGPANSALDDLRMLREKRQSVDTTPVLPPVSTPVSTPTSTPSSTPTSQSQSQKQPPNLTPVYINETKDQPPKKRVKEKRVKPAHKDRTSKREEEDEVAKILKDYRNQQNSTLKSVHEPSPPQAVSPQDSKKGSNNHHHHHHHHSAHPSPAAGTHHLPEEDPLSLSEYKQHSAASSSDDRKKQDGAKGATELLVLSSASYTATSVVSSLPEDHRTNQLKLKIKGPYANSYLNNNLSNPPVEASVNPTPPSTTTTLRRMRKKELIMQYCSSVSSSSSTPPQQQRTGITFPKAVASMTSVPTKEDYKMYTQDGSSSRGGNSTRRRRQPRELNQLDWTLLEDTKIKRNSEATPEGGRKRARAGKETAKVTTEESPGLHVTRTLRISLGKKGSSEVSEVTTTVPPAESLKGKPPKKRHEDIFSQVKSDNLKFRKEIMANFDKRGGTKTIVGEKKSRKRKFGFGEGSSGSSPLNSEIKEENSIGSSNDAQPKRIVLKISKTKSESPGGSETEERHGAAGGSHTNPNQPIPYPLKIRLNLANLSKNDACSDVSVRKRDTESPRLSSGGDQILPLKIKLQRRPEGYVTSKSSSLDESCALDQGPGPPPEPPDPPLDPPPANPLRNDSPIEHKDREALPPAGPSTHSRISEDVIQRLEAQLAATDGPPSTPDPSSSPPPIPQSSFSTLQPLPPLKDESGCR